MTGFDHKVAVVTGAGRMSSIGRSIAVELARAGCDVVVTGTGRPAERYPPAEQAVGWRDVESVADEIRAHGRRALAVVNDVTDAGSVDELCARVVGELGRVDILINNAGAARGPDRVPVLDVSPDAWRHVIDTNLTGAFLMSRRFGRVMVDQGRGGSIVNISSIGGKLSPPRAAAYAASKAGLQSLTASMASELADQQVRVNAICVGYVRTGRVDDLVDSGQYESIVRTNVPLGRAGTGDDIAHATVFLCSDQAAWITGQQWNVDGGQLTVR
ncbi:MAG: SDR family NAD(P)-dependent oxidoreductase [Acidimicrobiia bacterium]